MENHLKEMFGFLEIESPSYNDKIAACQFFIDNFAVATRIGYTKLEGIKITGGSNELISKAFDSLVKHMKDYKDGQNVSNNTN